MAKSLGQKMQDAIDKIAPLHPDHCRHYPAMLAFGKALEQETGFRVLVMSDAGRTTSCNIVAWHNGREIKNPELRNTKLINYFYS
jgi:hypothetical protein